MQLRAAVRSDRRAIAAFCLREDPDDYVPEWMGRFLREGRFFVLVDGKRIVGLVHAQLAPDGSAWLSAARIHHDYRGQGWINRLNDYALSSRALRGAHAARMLITASNSSSIRAAKKGGFRVAARLCLVEWDAPTQPRPAGAPSGFVPLGPTRFSRTAGRSPLLAAQGGLAYMPFTGAFSPTGAALRAKASWLFAAPRDAGLVAAFFSDTGEKWLATQPLRSGTTYASRLLAFAGELGADSMTAALPDRGPDQKPFLEAGFVASTWARHVAIFERSLATRAGGAIPSRARTRAAR